MYIFEWKLDRKEIKRKQNRLGGGCVPKGRKFIQASP